MKRHWIVFLTGVALAGVLAIGHGRASGAPGDLLQTFQKPSPDRGDFFGCSVAAVGSNVLVGARCEDTVAPYAGAAYLFDGLRGTLLWTLRKPSPGAYDLFGTSVAGVGGNLLVGADCDDTGAEDAGAAYLFDGSRGTLLRTFQKPRPAAYEIFGWSVAAVGGNVLVGARLDDTGATNAGAAYLFDGAKGNLLKKFQKPSPAGYDEFGYSVAAVGNDVLVGAWRDDAGATDAGAAYLFDGSTGGLLTTFLNPAPAPFDSFGFSVAGVGSNVLVGVPYDDAGGAAYLFNGVSGELLREFHNPTPGSNDYFGYSVAALGDNILIGAPNDDAGTADAGAVYLFDGSTGKLALMFPNPTPASGDYFGCSVAAMGSYVLVGACYDDAGARDAGAAYLFEGIPERATVQIDVRPGSWPNPLNAKSRGVLPLAVCGTEDLDVTTIDPGTILLGREGLDLWLAPLRWSVEDVATPYDNGEPGGHDLDGDGFPDLALKFSTEELAALFGLGGEPGNTIGLTLTGTLTDQAGGLEFEGLDWIWVLRTGDANLDGFVDIQDFYILKDNFAVGAGWSEGDFNDDGLVDIQDFAALKAHFGSGAAVSPLPEPASAVLLLIGLPWLLRRRRAKPKAETCLPRQVGRPAEGGIRGKRVNGPKARRS